jgi:cytochrome c oxidase cbb3-type subunit 3
MACLGLKREEENRKVSRRSQSRRLSRQPTTNVRTRFCWLVLFVALCLASFGACKREQRQFQQPPASFKTYDITMSDIRPGSAQPEPTVTNESEQKAYDVSEGKRLFTQYNCSGCHFNGGGGIGPALMDAQWVYGERSENIYATIVEGRPNGMPSFRHKIPDSQVWQLVAYVRSMSGQLRKDVAPNRSDDMSGRRSEQRTERKKPEGSGLPPSAQRP